jgi:signal peptidase I
MDKNKIIKEIRSWAIIIIVSVGIALFFDSTVFAKVTVEQSSMENTLFDSQQLIVDKISYNFKKPERGDIIIFLANEEKGNIFTSMARTVDGILSNAKGIEKHKRLVKRVIGVEGDEIDIKDGYVYINGIKLEEAYAVGETDAGEIEYPVLVGKNELFVLGDHRKVSVDSRAFGLIHCNQLEGKVIFRIFPFDKMGKID